MRFTNDTAVLSPAEHQLGVRLEKDWEGEKTLRVCEGASVSNSFFQQWETNLEKVEPFIPERVKRHQNTRKCSEHAQRLRYVKNRSGSIITVQVEQSTPQRPIINN